MQSALAAAAAAHLRVPIRPLSLGPSSRDTHVCLCAHLYNTFLCVLIFSLKNVDAFESGYSRFFTF